MSSNINPSTAYTCYLVTAQHTALWNRDFRCAVEKLNNSSLSDM